MKKTLAYATVVAGLVTGFAAAPASASDNRVSNLVRLINGERARAGRVALSVHPELAAYAARHSRDMAATDSIWHSPHVSRSVSVGTVVGENVGDGRDVESLHSMFMASAAHRANILDADYSYVGVGFAERDGWLFVTEIFAGTPHPVRKASVQRVVRVVVPAAAAPAPGAMVGAQNQVSILRRLAALDAAAPSGTATPPAQTRLRGER